MDIILLSGFPSITIVQLMAMLFFAATFMEAGLDKVINYQSNKAYFKDHFKSSPLHGKITGLFMLILLLEILTGTLSMIGIVFIFFNNTQVAFAAVVLAAITFLSLYFGQRLAKDFAGAAGLVPYLIFTLFSMYLFI